MEACCGPDRTGSVDGRSVAELLLNRVAATPDREAFRHLVDEKWCSLSWKETGERVRDIAMGLRELGLEDGQRCAILSNTRVEWILADLGILCGAGATTTIYPASTPEECVFVLTDSESAFVFAEDADQVAKLVEQRGELPGIKNVIVLDGAGGEDGWVLTLDELEAKGREAHERDAEAYETIARGVEGDALATMIYTSGTTGRPKGVQLTHDNWVYEGEGIDALELLNQDDVHFLWLPLAHSFGKVLEVAQLRIGFATAIDGRLDKIVENLSVIRPTFVAAVPRIFEKVHTKVQTGVREGGALKQAIFGWAVRTGRAHSQAIQRGEIPGGFLALKQKLATKLVFQKLQNTFGGRLRFFISGSAPLARDLIEFFHAAGVLILEGYGLTESSAATFVNRPGKYKFGTVGHPLPGTEVKLAEDGEILLRGRGIMRGYHGLDDATRETLIDGWLLTGDIGEIDEDGFLKITDRKKDLIKTAGGKYVAPQMIEGKLKALCPYLSHVAVHGDRRKYCTALVAFDPEQLEKWAAKAGFSGVYAELAIRPEASALIQPFVDQLNADLPRYATLKKFAVLPADLTVEAGELTTSLKMKRRVVEKNYMELLDGLYDEPRS